MIDRSNPAIDTLNVLLGRPEKFTLGGEGIEHGMGVVVETDHEEFLVFRKATQSPVEFNAKRLPTWSDHGTGTIDHKDEAISVGFGSKETRSCPTH